jgi:hypothetical protein
MGETPSNEGIPDGYDLPEKALGGADAVPDTNYVPPTETGPERPKGKGPAAATVAAGNGAVWAIIAFLIVGAVLVFLLGVFGIGQ